MNNQEQIETLISDGQKLFKMQKQFAANIVSLGPDIRDQEFTTWRMRCIAFLRTLDDEFYLIEFQDKVIESYSSHVQRGIGILKSIP